MEFVRADHLVVPEQAFGQVLDAADDDEGDGLDRDDEEDRGEEPAVPLDVAQQRVDERERDEEEADVLDRFRQIRRVESLNRVKHDHGGQKPGSHGAAGLRVLSRWGGLRRCVVPFSASPPRTTRQEPIASHAKGSQSPHRQSPDRAGTRRLAVSPPAYQGDSEGEGEDDGQREAGRASGGRGRRGSRRSRGRGLPGSRGDDAEKLCRGAGPTIWWVCHWWPG